MNLCIIQARMGSSRLPGKVLMKVAGKAILGQVVQRLKPAASIDKIVVATTTNPEDEAIEKYCESAGIVCFRGSDWDVLDRFFQAAKKNEAQHGDLIVRICCDNPIHHWKVVDFAVDEFNKLGVDYFSNSNQEPDFLEDGFDVEVTTFDAIADAAQNAKLLSEREHVMPYIKNSGKFRLGWRKACEGYHYKLSVDTANDLHVAETIFAELFSQPDFSIDEVHALLQRKPEILNINKESEINSGYKKSLREDRSIE
jgi:spore coat polysaccharide biosynthesis protein SpsF (cytidylyltransferase family)